MWIDHICMNKRCVNPLHLREVTPRISSLENTNGEAAKNSKKTHCINGHRYNDENILYRKGNGAYLIRRCRKCISKQRKAREVLKEVDNG